MRTVSSTVPRFPVTERAYDSVVCQCGVHRTPRLAFGIVPCVVSTALELYCEPASERAGDADPFHLVIETVPALEGAGIAAAQLSIAGESPLVARAAGAHRAGKRAERPMGVREPLVFAADSQHAGAEIMQPRECAAAPPGCACQRRAVAADDHAVGRWSGRCGWYGSGRVDGQCGMR